MSKLIHNRCTCKLIIKTAAASECRQKDNCDYVFTGLPKANPVIKCEQDCLLRRKMTELRNSYPEDMVCALFSLGLSNVRKIYSWSITRLFVETSG